MSKLFKHTFLVRKIYKLDDADFKIRTKQMIKVNKAFYDDIFFDTVEDHLCYYHMKLCAVSPFKNINKRKDYK